MARFTVLKCPSYKTGSTSTSLSSHTNIQFAAWIYANISIFVCKLLIINILNKIRYNSICIKGGNSYYFLVISIYFHVLYIKTQEKKTGNLHICCISVWNILFFILHICCISVWMPVLLFNSFINISSWIYGEREMLHPMDGFCYLKPLYGLF